MVLSMIYRYIVLLLVVYVLVVCCRNAYNSGLAELCMKVSYIKTNVFRKGSTCLTRKEAGILAAFLLYAISPAAVITYKKYDCKCFKTGFVISKLQYLQAIARDPLNIPTQTMFPFLEAFFKVLRTFSESLSLRDNFNFWKS